MTTKPCQWIARLGGACVLAILSATVASADPLALGAGDVVQISILNRDDLSGSYTLRSDGTISMHVLGETLAAGQTASQLEVMLEHMLSDRTKLPASVTVEVTHWRPIYVLGDVQAPGAFDFAPGMTVQQGVAVAGGLFRRDTANSTSLDVRISEETTQIETTKLRLRELSVIRARLEAEAADAETFTYAPKGNAAPAEIVKEQTNIFERRKDNTRDQITAARQALNLAKGEADSLSKQQGLLKTRIAGQEVNLAKIQSLFDKGLTNAERLNQEQRSLNSDRIELMTAATFEARARQQMGNAESAISEIIGGRQRDIATELADTASQERQQELALESSKGFLTKFASPVQTTMTAGEFGPPIYRVTRNTDAGPQNSELAATDLLMPGDTIEVLRLLVMPAN